MPLSGIEIYKMLPQTNCKECGYPTCLAFAMKLAAKQADLDACPYLSDEARETLEAAAAPPVRSVTLSADGREVKTGNETVLFRHEKRFVTKSGLFRRIRDDAPPETIRTQAKAVADYSVEYVGRELTLDGFAIQATGDGDSFASAIETILETARWPLTLMADDPDVMARGLEAAEGTRPLLYGATAETWEPFAELAQAHEAPLAVRADSITALVELTSQIKAAGVSEIVLDPGARDVHSMLSLNTLIRRMALKENVRPLGHPLIVFPGACTDDPALVSVATAQAIAKYGGLVVIDSFDPAAIYPLLVLRENIYTDPQEPIQVQPGIYEINEPDADAPAMVTTNFSITYFSVANEVDNSGIPGWLLVADAEGMSVLTAWAAGKFDAERIAKSIKKAEMEEKINHRRLIIPGYVSVLLGELEEELPGWEILVGPREAVDLPAYLKRQQAG